MHPWYLALFVVHSWPVHSVDVAWSICDVCDGIQQCRYSYSKRMMSRPFAHPGDRIWPANTMPPAHQQPLAPPLRITHQYYSPQTHRCKVGAHVQKKCTTTIIIGWKGIQARPRYYRPLMGMAGRCPSGHDGGVDTAPCLSGKWRDAGIDGLASHKPLACVSGGGHIACSMCVVHKIGCLV